MGNLHERHFILHFITIVLIISKVYYTMGTLYKLNTEHSVWQEDILETLTIKNKIQCASTCNQKNGCIGFGISSDGCILLKSLGNEGTCEESCLDLHEIKLYVLNDFKVTSTTAQFRSTTIAAESRAATTKKSLKTTTSTELTTITTRLPTTTKKPTKKTTPAPLPPPRPCSCEERAAYMIGLNAYTRFFEDTGGELLCQCMGNKMLYTGNYVYATQGQAPPGRKTSCPRMKSSGVVGLEVFYDMQGRKLETYRLTCDTFYDGIVDKNSDLVVVSSTPKRNKEVTCPDYHVMFGFHPTEQADGSFEVILECQKLIPR